MALERSPELEQAHHEMTAAYNKHDVEAMHRMISTHSAVVSRGTAPDEVVKGHDELIAAFAQSMDDVPVLTTADVEAYADGDLGYVYAENTFIDPDGTEYPSRGLAVAHREDGQWKFVHGLAAIPVPNDMLTPDSPFAAKKPATP
jgi:ketosteroid isomerase-like protein